MSKLSHRRWRGIAVLVLGAVAYAATAQEDPPEDPTPPSREEIMRMIDEALPSLIGDDNSGLVEQLLDARLGKPISENLDLDASLRAIFGRRRPALDPDCLRDTTASGDPSPDPCIATVGDAAGRGAYTEFSWSKNLGFGDLKFMRRLADGSVMPGEIKPVQMTDKEAYDAALNFLVGTMGVPPEEIPQAPDGANNPFLVRTLAIGGIDPTGRQEVIEAMKMVQIPRALLVNLRDPTTGRELPYVPSTGEAYVLMNDEGIWQASVRKWREMVRSSRVDPRNAKSRDELIEEITDTIMDNSASPIVLLGVRLELQAVEPVRSAASQKVLWAMLPAVQISISPVARDPDEDEQHQAGPDTAGHTLDFSLVKLSDEQLGASDD